MAPDADRAEFSLVFSEYEWRDKPVFVCTRRVSHAPLDWC